MGAIQAGLYLPRAVEAGLSRTVIVRRKEQAKHISDVTQICVNVASRHSLKVQRISSVDALQISEPACIVRLAEASHIAVAVSSVSDYPDIAPMIAAATRMKMERDLPPCIIYASENNVSAGTLLHSEIVSNGGIAAMFQCVDTVIGKISRTIKDPAEISFLNLEPGAPGLAEAWLVESYDDVHISHLNRANTVNAPLPRLTEHTDLEPLALAKLHGHNAAHAAIAYAGQMLGIKFIHDVLQVPAVVNLVRSALMQETGAALVAKNHEMQGMFSQTGWVEYSDSLFLRMSEKALRDSCERVGRDPKRKLGWNDRLIGTIRLVEANGIESVGWRISVLCACEATGYTIDDLRNIWFQDCKEMKEIELMAASLRETIHEFRSWKATLT